MFRRLVLASICVLFVGLVALRIWRYATFEPRSLRMPSPVAEAEEREHYLSAAGGYLLADIAANGNLLPSEKFRGFRPQHDFQPQPGDQLCPITRTKAHPECTWIVGGQTYEFCCPPCIGEFIRQAKEQPESLQPPGAYVMRRK